jgi:hypothetical protein
MGVAWILRGTFASPHPQNPFTPFARPGLLRPGYPVQPNLTDKGQNRCWVRTHVASRLSITEVHRKGLTLRDEGQMAESQLSELRNMRVLLEEARMLARNLAYHRRARLEDVLERVLEEVDRQVEDLRSSDRE